MHIENQNQSSPAKALRFLKPQSFRKRDLFISFNFCPVKHKLRHQHLNHQLFLPMLTNCICHAGNNRPVFIRPAVDEKPIEAV